MESKNAKKLLVVAIICIVILALIIGYLLVMSIIPK